MPGKASTITTVCLCLAAAVQAQTTGEVGVGYAWLQTTGNDDVFASQYALSNGLFLESLRLDLRSAFPGTDRCEIEAAGFGAEPWGRASLKADWDREWSLRFDVNRREGAFPPLFLGATVPSSFIPSQWHSNTFTITRWTGSLSYDGWSVGRLRLDLRDVQRSGSETFAFWGLGEPYVAHSTLNDRVSEAGLSLETRNWPVNLLIEQDVARYVSDSRGEAANGGEPLGGTSQYLLDEFTTPGHDTSTVPTTRLAATFRSDRFEIVGEGLYRRDRLDADRNDATGWALVGGAGNTSIIDALTGSADTNTSLGDLRVGFAVMPQLTLRVRGHYEDSTTDQAIAGDQILRIVTGTGPVDFPIALTDQGYLDRTDKDVSGEAEFRQGPFGLVVAYHSGSEQAKWQHGLAYTPQDTTRDASGWNATASLALGRTFTAQAGWQEDAFENYIFRTDPENVRRVWVKLTARPVEGLELALHGSRDRTDNPVSVAGLQRPVDAAGISATYATQGGTFASVSLDSFKLTSDTDIVFFAPTEQNGVSYYDTDLLTTTARVGIPLTRLVRVEAGATHLQDRGDSLPFTSNAYDARVEIAAPQAFEVSLFANYWKYDLSDSNDQDYKVTRYGIALRRRF